MPSPIFVRNDVNPVGLYRELDGEDSDLPTQPQSPGLDEDMDADDLRARRRSGKKAARVLGIADEDVVMADTHAYDGRRGSLSQLNLSTLSLREPPRGYVSMSDDDVPLLGGTSTHRGKTGKAYKRLGRKLLGGFRLSKAPKGKGRKRALSGGPSSLSTLASPFHDEADMEWEEEGAPSGSTLYDADMSAPDEDRAGSSASISLKTPKTPRRERHTSAPTTPRTSPRSAKSRRSSTHWQRTAPRTPLSAKSWRSMSDSSPGTGSDRSPGVLLRRAKRRRARDMASQTKILQLLGPEATGAVAQATNVKETKLRYRDFGRQLHDRLKRDL
ncbi:hypothetical protein TRAPUB_3983 [Trametes pubescens]|uniref:Uncharacterized protein n=1 Tax=Trametes pubescens TaxID=154538 RepID=A0A1M2VCG4_TRAPU|nr:hypothetical protein TRAPUB_3983 [Trametes pubescens]